jgi:hypothetical protein
MKVIYDSEADTLCRLLAQSIPLVALVPDK